MQKIDGTLNLSGGASFYRLDIEFKVKRELQPLNRCLLKAHLPLPESWAWVVSPLS